MKKMTIIFCLFSLLASAQKSDRLIYESDIVKSCERVKLKVRYYSSDVIEKNTSFLSMEQVFLKQNKEDGLSIISVYDYLNFEFSTFGLTNEIYLIIDDNAYFSIIPNCIIPDTKSERHLDKSEILNSDSTKVTVITGYSNFNKKTYKLHYQLTEKQGHLILDSNNIKFRYYSGPDMITLKLTRLHLQRLKNLIEYS